MPVASLVDVSVAFGGPPVLERVSLDLERDERVCLVGRNGAGKSTLLKVLARELEPDGGSVANPEGGPVRCLPQTLPARLARPVREVVAAGFGPEGEQLCAYLRGEEAAALDPERQGRMENAVERVLAELGLPGDAPFDALSGGMKRRALLGRALVCDPPLLVLDEPTNHLDIPAIERMEERLLQFRGALVFVAHDRAFLRRLSTRIVELDRARLSSWRCDYDTYLKRKEAAEEAEAKQLATLDRKLAREEAWIRQGIKARRTRNEGRVRALEKLRRERRAWREGQGQARFVPQEAGLSGRKVIEAKEASKSFGGFEVVRPFSCLIARSDRVGIVGPNGSGKTTLLNLLLGRLEPDGGSVALGSKLEIAYYDQLRERIDDERSVFDNVADGREAVTVGGRERSVMSYLGDFLFPPERARSPAKVLSGGERNRLLLARLFAQPANLLALDEPTNDLDAETLELLEERVGEFGGTVLIVSHDRAFLDNTVTSLLALDGRGRVTEFAGGYSDWAARQRPGGPESLASKRTLRPARSRAPRLTARQREELEALPARIEALEAERERLAQRMGEPRLLAEGSQRLRELQSDLEALEKRIGQCYGRWEELEALRAAAASRR